MTIAETREICKGLFARVPRDALIVAVLVLASFLSFGLGYLAGKDATAQGSGISLQTAPDIAATTTEQVVASRNGTKYYHPWCAGADRIAETNKVWFPTAASARSAGYTLSANCEGL
ncbi:MAG: hypothetical protein ACYCPH_01680 [Minisyncoccota bacterium]